LDPVIFSVFATYYTETLLCSNFRGPLFSRTCQAREICEITGMRKKTSFTVIEYNNKSQDSVYHAVIATVCLFHLTTAELCFVC